MRIKSGSTTEYVYFVAVDATDLKTRETGLTTFTVYRSRNGAAAAAMTTPTVNEVDATNMPGVYELLVDEDTTLGAGNDSEEMVFHITQASMAPVTRSVEIYRTNVDAISGDTTAADNLELMYDGTGYTDDTAPASRSQVGQLSTGSAAISTTAQGATITTGTQTLTYTATTQLDGTVHQVEDAAGTTDFYYEFDIGGDGSPVNVQWDGYAQSQGDSYAVYLYNWGATDWDQVGTLSGSNGTTVGPETFTATIANVGTGANAGLVRLRFQSTDGTNLATDRVLCSYAIVARSVGYSLGAIWVDTNASNTNTESYVDGVADNPVSTWAAALTLSSQLGIDKFQIAAGSAITLSADSTGYEINGSNYTLALNGQTIDGAIITGAWPATGTGVATSTQPQFVDCAFGTTTLPPSRFNFCGFGESGGALTVGSPGDFSMADCYSIVAGSGSPAMDFSGAGPTTTINVRRWAGGATYTLDADCTLSHEVLAGGGTTITTGGGDAEIRGITRSLTLVLSGSGTVQFVGTVGPVAMNGNTTATVNLYGVSASVTDTTAGGGVTLTDNTVSNQNAADEMLNRDMSAVSDTNARTPLNALRALRNKVGIAAGTMTVTKEDDTTSAWTAAVTGDAAADPVTEIDPA